MLSETLSVSHVDVRMRHCVRKKDKYKNIADDQLSRDQINTAPEQVT